MIFIPFVIILFILSFHSLQEPECRKENILNASDIERIGNMRSNEFHNIDIHMKEDLTMDSAAPLNGTPSITRLDDGGILEFVTSRPLYGDLPVKGVVDEERNAFKLFLTTIYTGNTVSSLTIRIFDGPQEVASSTFADGDFRTNPKMIFYDPTVAPENLYTFHEGNNIRVRINVSIEEGPLSGSVTISYDSTNTDSHLSLFTHQVREITHDTYRDDIKINTFEPNLPDSTRYLDVKGDVTDIIGDYDIMGIEIFIYDPENTQIGNVTGVLDAGVEDEVTSFAARWEYEPGHPAGKYTIKAVIIDNNLNHVNSTLTFTMAKYGIYLSSDEYERAAMAGSKAVFDITIRNTGGDEDTILLEVKVKPSSWAHSMEDQVTVSPGSFRTAELSITIPADSKEGDSCTVEVTASSQGDPHVEATLPENIRVAAVTRYMFTAVLNDDKAQEIGNGDTANYRFTVSNLGDKDDSVIIEIPEAPRDWGAGMTGDIVTVENNDTYPMTYIMELPEGGERDATLTVTSPDAPTDNTRAELTIRFTSENESAMSLTRTTITTTQTTIEEILELQPDKVEGTSEYDGDDEEFETARFEIEIENPALEKWTIDLDVEADHEASEWDVQYPSTLEVSPGSRRTAAILITPAANAIATEKDDEGIEFRLDADVRGKEGANMRSSVHLRVKVGQFYSMILSLRDEGTKTINRGGSEVSFDLEIKNTGNGRDRMEFGTNDASSWTVDFSPREIELAPEETKRITVKVTAPDEIEDGTTKVIRVEAAGEGDTVEKLTLKVDIEIGIRERFDDLVRDIDFWVIMGLFLAVVLLLVRIRYTLKKKE